MYSYHVLCRWSLISGDNCLRSCDNETCSPAPSRPCGRPCTVLDGSLDHSLGRNWPLLAQSAVFDFLSDGSYIWLFYRGSPQPTYPAATSFPLLFLVHSWARQFPSSYLSLLAAARLFFPKGEKHRISMPQRPLSLLHLYCTEMNPLCFAITFIKVIEDPRFVLLTLTFDWSTLITIAKHNGQSCQFLIFPPFHSCICGWDNRSHLVQ